MKVFHDKQKLFQRRKISVAPKSLKQLKEKQVNSSKGGSTIFVATVSPNYKAEDTFAVPDQMMFAEEEPKRKSGLEITCETNSPTSIKDNYESSDCQWNTKEGLQLSANFRERLNSLTKDINRRTSLIKDNLFKHNVRPDSDSSDQENYESDDDIKDIRSLNSYVDDLAPSPFSTRTILDTRLLRKSILSIKFLESLDQRWETFYLWHMFPRYVNPQSDKYLVWLSFLSCCFLYNAVVIPLRATFPYQTAENSPLWMIFDYFCDIIYLVDMVIVKCRLRYLSHGSYIKNRKQLIKRYLYSIHFKTDLLSLLPLDLLYFDMNIGPNVLLRLNRLFKFSCYNEFINRLDRIVDNPYIIRISRTIGYLIYSIHLNSCIFYTISKWEGLGSTSWTYNGQGTAYLRCFYLATQFATVCGQTPDPTNVVELVHTLISGMVGVFITVILLGQIKDIAAKASKNKAEFRNAEDKVLGFCKDSKVPDYVQQKVRDYFYYMWQYQRTLDERKLINGLSRKLQIDLAISVHYETLSKVHIFQNCEKAFLRSLVTKLKPIICMPGSYVCKKGERITEMFIVGKGILSVQNELELLATLKEGSVFGEAGLLLPDNSTRRMVDIVSKGYSNLFTLQKEDLMNTLEDYPDELKTIKKLTRKFSTKEPDDFDLQEISKISTLRPTPKLFQAAVDVVNKAGNSEILTAMKNDRRESKISTERKIFEQNIDSSSSDFEDD